jgi:hypothetical protein
LPTLTSKVRDALEKRLARVLESGANAWFCRQPIALLYWFKLIGYDPESQRPPADPSLTFQR